MKENSITVNHISYDAAMNSYQHWNEHGELLWKETAEIQHIAIAHSDAPSLERINHHWKGRDPR